jgi:hypothetical protein
VIISLAIVVIMSVDKSGRIPWCDKMRRLSPAAEWMAPEEVVQQVGAHYLEAVNWLYESTLLPWSRQWSGANKYLSGTFLSRQRNLLLTQRSGENLSITGVLRADHGVEARRFNENGDFCVVIDQQSQRRMATYNRIKRERLHTQDLGDATVVYAMMYDAKDQRWKIGGFIQELPVGWRSRPLFQELQSLPGGIGRDY